HCVRHIPQQEELVLPILTHLPEYRPDLGSRCPHLPGGAQPRNSGPFAGVELKVPRSPARLSSLSIQFGNGLLGHTRNAVISSLTSSLRSISVLTNLSRASQSLSYHSGGISPATPQITSSSINSTHVNHGSNDSQPRTGSYTSFRAYTPRSGLSGNDHSPALKQYPWSIKLAVYFRSRDLRQNAACLPFALAVHLSITS